MSPDSGRLLTVHALILSCLSHVTTHSRGCHRGRCNGYTSGPAHLYTATLFQQQTAQACTFQSSSLASRLSKGPTWDGRSRPQTLSFPDGQFYPHHFRVPQNPGPLFTLCSYCPASSLDLQYHIHMGRIPPQQPQQVPHSPSSCSGLAPLPGWMTSSLSCLTWLVAPARA